MFESVKRFRFWPALVLILASFVYVGVNVPKHREFSPYDEYVYLDYLDKVPTQLFVHQFEKVGDFARNEISCRGVVGFGPFGQGCDRGSHRADVTYPYSGYTGADIYSPAYFVITWTLAQPLTWFGLDLLDAGRLVGAIWLASGLLLLYGAMRELGVSRRLAVGLNLMVMISPAMYWADTYLATDAPSLAAGAALLYAGILIAKGKLAAGWLIPLSALVVLVKVQNLAAVLLVGLALVGLATWNAYRPVSTEAGPNRFPLKPTLLAIAALVAGVLAQVVWLVIRSHSALPPVLSPGADTNPQKLTQQALVSEAFKYLFKVGASDLNSGVTGTVAASVLTALSVGGVIAMIVDRRTHSRTVVTFAAVTLGVALLIGPALATSTLVMTGNYFPLPVRYGIVLIPAFVTCAAVFLSRSRKVGTIMLVAGLAMAAIVIVI
jgi:hypothetical protein